MPGMSVVARATGSSQAEASRARSAPVHVEAERFAQFVELLLPCLAPRGIGGEFAGRDMDLPGDEIQRRLWEDLARPEQAAWIAERTELQGIAEPVATAAPSRDGGQACFVQSPVTDEVVFRPRQGEEAGQLRIGEHAAPGHGRPSQLR